MKLYLVNGMAQHRNALAGGGSGPAETFSGTLVANIAEAVERLVAFSGLVAKTVAVWVFRHRQRQALAELDDHMLRDIGLDRWQAEHETAKPFWQA